MMEHKGYRATVTFDDATGVFHGEVVDTRDVIVFEGTSADSAQEGVRILGRRLPEGLRRTRQDSG